MKKAPQKISELRPRRSNHWLPGPKDSSLKHGFVWSYNKGGFLEEGKWEPLVSGHIMKLGCLDLFGCLDLTTLKQLQILDPKKFAARTEVLEHELKRERDEKAELEK